MERIKKPYIDWSATADNLKLLRRDNIKLRRYVCNMLGTSRGQCNGNCEGCRLDMDMHISQKELATVLGVTENMIINWETCRSKPKLEYLIMYSQICEIDFTDVIVFAKPRARTVENNN